MLTLFSHIYIVNALASLPSFSIQCKTSDKKNRKKKNPMNNRRMALFEFLLKKCACVQICGDFFILL